MGDGSLDRRFGDLRSLMQSPRPGPEWSEALLRLLLSARDESPGAFDATWSPYLASFNELWASLPVALSDEAVAALSLDGDLSSIASVLPYARYALSFEGVMLTHARLDLALETARSLSLDSLSIDGVKLDSRRVGALAELSGEASPRAMTVRNTNLGRLYLSELGSSGLFESIESLDLESSEFSDRALVALMGSGHLPSLRELNLEANAVSDEGFGALVSMERAPLLRDVNLSRCPLTPSAMKHWTDEPGHWTGLDLSSTLVGEEGVLSVARSRRTASLTSLKLSNVTQHVNSPFAALVVSDHVRALKQLDVSSNGLGRVFVDALSASYSLRSLEELDLGGNRVDSEGLESILSSPAARHLTSLKLGGCPIGPDELHVIAAAMPEMNLTRLTTGGRDPVSADTLRMLSHTPGFERLRYLNLSGKIMDSAGVVALVESDRMALDALFLTGRGLDDDGSAALRGAGFASLAHEPGMWSRRGPSRNLE